MGTCRGSCKNGHGGGDDDLDEKLPWLERNEDAWAAMEAVVVVAGRCFSHSECTGHSPRRCHCGHGICARRSNESDAGKILSRVANGNELGAPRGGSSAVLGADLEGAEAAAEARRHLSATGAGFFDANRNELFGR